MFLDDYLNPNNPKYDKTLPSLFKQSIQQFDNYGVYSFARYGKTVELKKEKWNYKKRRKCEIEFQHPLGGTNDVQTYKYNWTYAVQAIHGQNNTITYQLVEDTTPITITTKTVQPVDPTSFVSWQKYNINPITVDFSKIVLDNYPDDITNPTLDKTGLVKAKLREISFFEYRWRERHLLELEARLINPQVSITRPEYNDYKYQLGVKKDVGHYNVIMAIDGDRFPGIWYEFLLAAPIVIGTAPNLRLSEEMVVNHINHDWAWIRDGDADDGTQWGYDYIKRDELIIPVADDETTIFDDVTEYGEGEQISFSQFSSSLTEVPTVEYRWRRTNNDASLSGIYNPQLPYGFLRLNYYIIWQQDRKFFELEIYADATANNSKNNLISPNYKHLITGKPDKLSITAQIDNTYDVEFYYKNKLEPLKIIGLSSLNIYNSTHHIKQNETISVPLHDGIVYNTLKVSPMTGVTIDLGVNHSISKYLYSGQSNIDNLLSEWAEPPSEPSTDDIDDAQYPIYLHRQTNTITSIFRHFGEAHNDYWHNNQLPIYLDNNDGFKINGHQLSNLRLYNWHLKPINNQIGELLMDSPRLVELHAMLEVIIKCLDADKYAINELDDEIPRYTTLGKMVELSYQMLGGVLNANGKIDRAEQRESNPYKIHKNPSYRESDYSLVGFGKKGLIMQYQPNGRNSNGGYQMPRNIPQMILCALHQIDVSFGLQESANISVPVGNRQLKYHNQSALLIDQSIALDEIVDKTRKMYISSLITQQQTSETLFAFGNQIATKFLRVYSEAHRTNVLVPYKGVVPDETLQRDLLEIKSNIGIMLGQIL